MDKMSIVEKIAQSLSKTHKYDVQISHDADEAYTAEIEGICAVTFNLYHNDQKLMVSIINSDKKADCVVDEIVIAENQLGDSVTEIVDIIRDRIETYKAARKIHLGGLSDFYGDSPVDQLIGVTARTPTHSSYLTVLK